MIIVIYKDYFIFLPRLPCCHMIKLSKVIQILMFNVLTFTIKYAQTKLNIVFYMHDDKSPLIKCIFNYMKQPMHTLEGFLYSINVVVYIYCK